MALRVSVEFAVKTVSVKKVHAAHCHPVAFTLLANKPEWHGNKCNLGRRLI
jgi:hypothetical protein